MSGFWTLKIGKSKQEDKKDDNSGKKRDAAGNGSPEVVRSLMDRVLDDAEQLVESIKVKAKKEAADEIARLKQQTELKTTETSVQTTGSDDYPYGVSPETAVSEPEERKPERTEVEFREQPSATPESAAEEISEKVTGPDISDSREPEMQAAPEPVSDDMSKEEPTGETGPAATEEIPERVIADSGGNKEEEYHHTAMTMDRKELYTEEVELVITTPVDPAAVSKLYNNLQMTPEIKIMYTRGSWDKGTIITVALEKPLPLLDIISGIEDIEVTTLEPQQKDETTKPSIALLGGNKKNLKRIDLLLKAR